MSDSPQVLALVSALCSAIGTMLIQRGLRRSNFYAGFWINVAVGAVGLWSAVLLFVAREEWDWRGLPYFAFSGVVGTACGRLFRVAAIDKVGAPVAAAIANLAPLIATVLAILLLHERVTLAILTGTLVIVLGTVLLSLSGKHVGFPPRYLVYPFLAAFCFGLVQIVRKMGLSQAGPLFDAALNITAALIASTAFIIGSGNLGALRCDRASFLYLASGGAFENTGVLLVIVALGYGEVSVVSPLSATAPLFVLLLALLFPSDVQKLGWRVAAGTVLIVLGVFLLTGLKTG
ncbi:MAG TPA: DMT family transporter [Actinomycetes bacterium]